MFISFDSKPAAGFNRRPLFDVLRLIQVCEQETLFETMFCLKHLIVKHFEDSLMTDFTVV